MTAQASDNSKKRLAAEDCGDFDPVFGAELPTIIGGRPPAPDNSKKRSGAERSRQQSRRARSGRKKRQR
jgi:hypothetical protein